MSQTAPPCNTDRVPPNWKVEPYPSTDREWLTASFIAPALQVGVAVLVAESLTGDGLVYPIAATADVDAPVDDRLYDLTDVALDQESAMTAARSLMERFSGTFTDGGADFVAETIRDARTDARNTVRTPTDATDVAPTDSPEPEYDDCARCGGDISKSDPVFGAVSLGAVNGGLDEYWCADCEFGEKPHSGDTSGTIVIMTVAQDGDAGGSGRDWRVLRSR